MSAVYPPSSHAPDVPPKRRRTAHRSASLLLVGLGVVANVAAVADLFMKHLGALGMVAGLLAVVAGMYLLLADWGKRVGWKTLLAVAIVVAGSVTLSLILQKGGYINTDGGTHNDKEQRDDDAVLPQVDKGKRYTLDANEGLDLDDGKEAVVVQQIDARSPSDLYFNDWAFLDLTVKEFYPYQPPKKSTGNAERDAYVSCRNLIATSQLGQSTITASGVEPDKRYCALTTKDVVMLITVEEIIDRGIASRASTVSFYVKLLKE